MTLDSQRKNNEGISPKSLKILKQNTREQFMWFDEWMGSDRYFELLVKEFEGNKDKAQDEWDRRKNEMQILLKWKNIRYVPWILDRQMGRYMPRNHPSGITAEPLNNDGKIYAGEIAFAESVTRERKTTTIIHEWSHFIDNSGEFIPPYTALQIFKNTKIEPWNEDDGEVETDAQTKLPFYTVNLPTEWIARLQQLRFLLHKEEIYEAKDGELTDEHIEKMKKNKKLQRFLIDDSGLLDNIEWANDDEKYENLKKFLNTVASNKLTIPGDVFPQKIEQNLDILQGRTEIG